MKYAIIKLGGKQIMVSEGDTFEIERQNKLDMDVLMYSDGKNVMVGTPELKNVKVKATLEDAGLGKKIRVARFRAKSRYRRIKGHRQPISKVSIESITKVVAKKEPITKKTVKKAKKD
jgi:large subunit ribosomal protein L21